MDKIQLLWRLVFPICLFIALLFDFIFFSGSDRGYGIIVVIPVSVFALYVIFLGIEELFRYPKRNAN